MDEPFNIIRTLKEIFIGWGPLLAVSPWLVISASSLAGFSLARQCHMNKMKDTEVQLQVLLPSVLENTERTSGTSGSGISAISTSVCWCSYPSRNMTQIHFTKTIEILKRPGLRKLIYVVGLAFTLAALISVQTNLHMMYPSWFWNPFLLGYSVYFPESIAEASAGMCIEEEISRLSDTNAKAKQSNRMSVRGLRDLSGENNPLCLPEKSWKSLSTDALSSKNEEDVRAVIEGARYLKNDSGGIAFGIMSRDTIGAIAPLRLNVEGLLPFTPNLSVVVFENDSTDGSREEFIEWSREVEGKYIVDVVKCKDSPDCKFNVSHRDFEEELPYEKTSAIGRMGEFRQRLISHVLEDPRYSDYSHFLVLDIDLSVSISPLGILHTLGKLPDEAVASSGRQPRPGSFGSLQPPYDFSAFVAHENPLFRRMIKLNERFCALRPEGFRWRNECRAVSVAQFTMIQIGDNFNGGEPYLVNSAFNGAVLYPIKLIRETKAKYDSGTDGQRCEHIGFNLSLKRPMYINPKWDMHLHPHLMGGPSGKRAMRTITDIAMSPAIGPIVFGQSMFSMIIFIYCIMTLTMLIIYPLWVCLSRAIIGNSEILSKTNVREGSKSPSIREMEFLLNPDLSIPSRKRKGSETVVDSDQLND